MMGFFTEKNVIQTEDCCKKKDVCIAILYQTPNQLFKAELQMDLYSYRIKEIC